MAKFPIQPDECTITKINQDGVEVVTDYQFVVISLFPGAPPVYQSEELVCPHCDGKYFRYFGHLGSNPACHNCATFMVEKIFLRDVEKVDIIESRFEILDL